ncbi:MAG TPA: TolC family protein [Gemmatimonadaceae bacterium]|nr:TolC family protein [Gemmatimonadaceae bacterium]
MFRKLILLVAAPALLAAQQMPSASSPGDSAFHPISLAEAVKLAQENNVSAVIAENSIRTATTNVRTAFGQFLPSLTGSLGQSQSGGQRLGPQGDLVPYTANPWSYTTGLRTSLNLFDGGSRLATYRQDKAIVTAQEAAQTNTKFNLAFQVKQTYNLILAAKESEAAARAQLELANTQLATTTAKVNAGAANISDSLRSVVQVGNAQLAILTAQNSFRVASASLTHLVGTRYFVTADLADTVEKTYAPIDSVAIMTMALNGPQIRQTQAQLNADQAGVRASRSSYFPSIDLGYNYSGNGFDKYYGLGSGQLAYNHTLSLSASYPIFNGFTREANIARNQVNVENDQANLRDQQLAAQQNIVTDLGSLRVAEETMRIQELNVRADEEDLRVVQQRYALGASTLLEVQTSQSNLITARQQLIQARLNYRNARAQIESVIGRDLP